MQHGLSDQTIKKIVSVFETHTEIENVVLYGSRAKGNYRKGSDIDLTILGRKISLRLLQRIENELDDLLLPYTIDVSIFTHIKNQTLLEHIERVGVVFYARQKEQAMKD